MNNLGTSKNIIDTSIILWNLIIAGILLNIGGAGEVVRKFFRKIADNRHSSWLALLDFTGAIVMSIGYTLFKEWMTPGSEVDS